MSEKQLVFIVTDSSCCGHENIVAVFAKAEDARAKADSLYEGSWSEWEVN